MMKHRKLNLLTDKFFLVGLATLLLNDFVLKYEMGGWVTGKLSDISGLFIFPFFWSIFFERQRLMIYTLTAVMFVIWKLPVSTGALNAINEFSGTSFSRVVDYTDLFALLVMPVSWKYFNYQLTSYPQKPEKLIAPIGISVLSLIAFVATSMLATIVRHPLRVNQTFICNVKKDKIFRENVFSRTPLEVTLADTTYLIRHTVRHGAEASTWVRMYPLDSTHTIIIVDSVRHYSYVKFLNIGTKRKGRNLKGITREEFIADFKKYVIQRIESKEPAICISMENPKDIVPSRSY